MGFSRGKNTGVGCRSLLQGIFLIQRLNPHHPHSRQILYHWDTHTHFCCSVAQSCPMLCDPMDSAHQASLSFTISWSLLKLMSLESVMPSNHLILCHPFSCLQSFPASGSFLMSQFFESGGQSIGVAASAQVLPVIIQDWFPLGWTGWISLLSKGLSRVFSNTTVQNRLQVYIYI